MDNKGSSDGSTVEVWQAASRASSVSTRARDTDSRVRRIFDSLRELDDAHEQGVISIAVPYGLKS